MILFLHHRYRSTGGEERAVEDLAWLARVHLGEDVEVLERDSTSIGARAAAGGLLRGGLDPGEVARAVRRTGARIVHAHNLHPTFGWRALAAARAAGAKVVLHLHQYRLVCAVGTCVDPSGSDCTRCHGHNTMPGLRHGCRDSRAEGAAYAVGLALQQRRLLQHADAVVVPSAAALERLRALGAPLREATVLGHVVRGFAPASCARDGAYALVACRLAPEKGVADAVAACAQAGVRLVVAGDGPLAGALRAAGGAEFVGQVDNVGLHRLRAGAGAELVLSRAHESFGLSAVEALAAGVPVVATHVGALRALQPVAELVAPGDVGAAAQALRRVFGDEQRGQRGIAFARDYASPEVVAPRLQALYASL